MAPIQAVQCEWREDAQLLAGIRFSLGDWILGANLQDELKFFVDALRTLRTGCTLRTVRSRRTRFTLRARCAGRSRRAVGALQGCSAPAAGSAFAAGAPVSIAQIRHPSTAMTSEPSGICSSRRSASRVRVNASRLSRLTNNTETVADSARSDASARSDWPIETTGAKRPE